jgi:hypothetical protein
MQVRHKAHDVEASRELDCVLKDFVILTDHSVRKPAFSILGLPGTSIIVIYFTVESLFCLLNANMKACFLPFVTFSKVKHVPL